jgi:hypothetical protein
MSRVEIKRSGEEDQRKGIQRTFTLELQELDQWRSLDKDHFVIQLKLKKI